MARATDNARVLIDISPMECVSPIELVLRRDRSKCRAISAGECNFFEPNGLADLGGVARVSN
jgi:hypothetical protein